MEIIREIIDHIVVAILISLGSFLFIKRRLAVRTLKMLYYRNRECRVSFGCLLVIKEKEKFLLIRNNNHPESLGPVGGVYKYFPTAVGFLDTLPFRQQQIGN